MESYKPNIEDRKKDTCFLKIYRNGYVDPNKVYFINEKESQQKERWLLKKDLNTN